MGTDIHAAIEYRNDVGIWKALYVPNRYFGKWADEKETTPRLYLDRDYNLFAILANVRNGVGFAGCKTGEGFVSITSQRGLPSDISEAARELACTGDHSETWVSLAELLAFDWEQVASLSGIVTAVEFERWERMKEWQSGPESWCGGRSGPGIREVSNAEMRRHVAAATAGVKPGENLAERLGDRLQTRISWQKSYAECASQLWERVLPRMLNLSKRYGAEGVRLVMNFDS